MQRQKPLLHTDHEKHGALDLHGQRSFLLISFNTKQPFCRAELYHYLLNYFHASALLRSELINLSLVVSFAVLESIAVFQFLNKLSAFSGNREAGPRLLSAQVIKLGQCCNIRVLIVKN